jgi:WD40 repeat protein
VRTVLIAGVWMTLSVAVCGQALKPLAKLEAPHSVDFAVVCDGGESIVGVTEKHDVYAWSVRSGTRNKLNVTGGDVNWRTVACNPKVLAVGLSSGAVAVFNSAGTETQRFDLEGSVGAIAVSEDGSLVAAATYFGPVQLWDVASGKHLWTGSIDFGNTASIGILPDGSLIIAADTDTHIRAYNRQGMLAYSADGGLLEPFGLSLSADGKKFAVGGMGGVLVLYDSASGKRLNKSDNSRNTIWGVVMASAGTKVVAEEEDDGYRMDTVAIGYWDTAGTELKKLAVDPKTVIGWGKNAEQLLLLRQQSPGLISVDAVE